MKKIILSVIAAASLYGADPQNILNDVANLRQKYEQCVQEQKADPTGKIKGYQQRIAVLENRIKEGERELQQLKKGNTDIARELSQKNGVIQSLEKSLTSKDRQYREAVSQNEKLTKEANGVKVGKIERENLKRALIRAKSDLEELEKSMGKTDKEVLALTNALKDAKQEIERLRLKPSPTSPKVIVEEKIVTKVVEPTEKITALQRELLSAHATIEELRKGTKPVVQEKIVEKIVYKERPTPQEKVVEKIIYKDRPVLKEKIVEKIVYKERPVIQEKIVEKVVYKERPIPQEKKVSKSHEATERLNQALQQKLEQPEEQRPKNKIASAPSAKKGKSSAYRMATTSTIYNAPGGSAITTWEERRSFTAGEPTGGWVRITGYFVNRVWQPTAEGENLWVRESDVMRR
jgi:predicted  nucleic acid-binding Zn-ribbon protein